MIYRQKVENYKNELEEQLVIIGNLANDFNKDMDIKYYKDKKTGENKPIIKLTVLANDYKNEEPTFFKASLFGNVADRFIKLAEKGALKKGMSLLLLARVNDYGDGTFVTAYVVEVLRWASDGKDNK